MSEAPNKEDELAGTEQPFVQHLMELRDRLVKAMIAIAIAAAILFFFPGPGALYDFLAAPLVANLPKGATLLGDAPATAIVSVGGKPVVVESKTRHATSRLRGYLIVRTGPARGRPGGSVAAGLSVRPKSPLSNGETGRPRPS